MDRQKIWIQSGTARNYDEYVIQKTGKSIDELCDTQNVHYDCPGIAEAGELLKQAVKEKKFIQVIVDYDADGINSGAEIYMILARLGVSPQDMSIVVPQRMRDGYGMNIRMLEDTPDNSFVMTIDNGIAAYDPIVEAKRRGMTVVVLDHHQQNGEIPPADLIVDPEAFPDGWTFDGYCGAGLTYKLAEYLFPEDKILLAQLSCFAAIATVGDSVNVTGDNRNIIMNGIANMNAGNCTQGLRAILDVLRERDKIEHFDIYEIAYKIAPMINAPGRLRNEGGRFVLSCLFQTGTAAREKAVELYEENLDRKALVDTIIDKASPKGEKICFIYDERIPEGLCGIVAGHLASETHKPSFVLTKAEDGSVKGSARCEEPANVFLLTKSAESLLLRFGGHECAAGLSLEEKNVDALFQHLEKEATVPGNEDRMYFDFYANSGDLFNIYIKMRKAAVYGVGFENPVICVRANITDAKEIGSDKSHLTFFAGNVKCIAFSMAEDYKKMGSPTSLTLYGTLTSNWWRGRANMQFQVCGLEK